MAIESAAMKTQSLVRVGAGRGVRRVTFLLAAWVTVGCGSVESGTASDTGSTAAEPAAEAPRRAAQARSPSADERTLTLGELARAAETRSRPQDAPSEPAAEPKRPRRRSPGAAEREQQEGDPQHRPLPRRGEQDRDRGDLVLVYGDLENPDHQGYQEVFREERVLEDVLDELNRQLVLPYDVEIRLVECGEVNAFYDGNERAVAMCFELLDHFLGLFAADASTDEELEMAGAQGLAAFIFVFYHELGHALIDVLELPVTGREEDAVDQLATVVLLETWEGEDSELALLSSAEWFGISSEDAELDMADEHALDEQRYYNLLCWTFGSDPDYFSDLTSDDWGLPEERAVRCPEEYAQMSAAWETLLAPHLDG
jgi:hypothetical protein